MSSLGSNEKCEIHIAASINDVESTSNAVRKFVRKHSSSSEDKESIQKSLKKIATVLKGYAARR